AAAGVVEGTLTLGDLVMVNAFLLQMFQPLSFLGVMYRQIKESITDVERMFALMQRPREVEDAQDARELDVVAGEVKFEHVSFAYNPDRPILHDVSFTIPAGKTVAVVGPSGSGKSTLARLLYRFYDVTNSEPPRSPALRGALPPEGAEVGLGRPGANFGPNGAEAGPHGFGCITINGQDIKGVTQSSVRQAIGIVPQDTVLFNDTIEYNILYGRPEAGHDAAVQAAQAAHIHSFIEKLPLGYRTMVGERGLKLSGGEKQRVAIARTLLKNPPIVIFDEATSALDSANERAIQAELKTAARNKTTLVIAHRLSTVVDAHEILVLVNGEIVERGTHADLVARGGVYAGMWALQQSGAD
ncbi:MAG: ATP-binding cassette domain-containing protein, partial [Hydrogenophaga sp.]|nr:ATP-binding cassette domain-containing protein [Hydrogenophaga sp.]